MEWTSLLRSCCEKKSGQDLSNVWSAFEGFSPQKLLPEANVELFGLRPSAFIAETPFEHLASNDQLQSLHIKKAQMVRKKLQDKLESNHKKGIEVQRICYEDLGDFFFIQGQFKLASNSYSNACRFCSTEMQFLQMNLKRWESIFFNLAKCTIFIQDNQDQEEMLLAFKTTNRDIKSFESTLVRLSRTLETSVLESYELRVFNSCFFTYFLDLEFKLCASLFWEKIAKFEALEVSIYGIDIPVLVSLCSILMDRDELLSKVKSPLMKLLCKNSKFPGSITKAWTDLNFGKLLGYIKETEQVAEFRLLRSFGMLKMEIGKKVVGTYLAAYSRVSANSLSALKHWLEEEDGVCFKQMVSELGYNWSSDEQEIIRAKKNIEEEIVKEVQERSKLESLRNILKSNARNKRGSKKLLSIATNI